MQDDGDKPGTYSRMKDFSSLRELDQALQEPKGTAFRLFKDQLPQLREGLDFIVLMHDQDAELIKQLKHCDRIYSQSRNVVMLNRECFRRLNLVWKGQSD